MGQSNSERIITPMPKALVAAIDDYRFANRLASRAETIRALILRGLSEPAQFSPQPRPGNSKGAN